MYNSLHNLLEDLIKLIDAPRIHTFISRCVMNGKYHCVSSTKNVNQHRMILKWINIQFVIYFGAFLVEILDELAYRDHLRGKSRIGDLGYRAIQDLFEGLNYSFWGQKFISCAKLVDVIPNSETFPIIQESPQSKFV